MRAATLKHSLLGSFVGRNDPSAGSNGLEAWRRYLQRRMGTTGTLYDLEVAFLRREGATGGGLDDLWFSFLTVKGYNPSEDGMRKFFAEAIYVPVSFNPATALGFRSAYWASDPSWTPPSDGAGVSSWNDGSGGGRHLVQATADNQPIYRAAYTDLNSKPAVEFDGTADYLQLASASFGTVNQPDTIVVVFNSNSDSAGTQNISDADNTTSATRQIVRKASSAWNMFAGSGLAGGTPDLNSHLLRCYYNNTSSVISLDGTTLNTGAAGTGTLTGLTMGASAAVAGFYPMAVAFWGVYQGDITTNTNWNVFRQWVRTTYGITIA